MGRGSTTSPEPEPEPELLSYAALKSRGNACFKARQYDKAASEYSAALRCADTDAERAVALNNRALARLEMGECEGAVEDASAVIVLEPSNVRHPAVCSPKLPLELPLLTEYPAGPPRCRSKR